jgi:nucleoside-diphosphate-sugar epimerase
MNILIIGGTGFISGALSRRLLRRGEQVTLLTRGRTALPADLSGTARVLVADRNDHRALASAVGGRTFDAVFDMVAYEPEASASAAAIFRGKVGRFIHCSTISVYMVSDQVQCPVTEDQDHAPLMSRRGPNPFGFDYGLAKRKCEGVLWGAHDEKAFPVSMLRPTYVSGPEDPTMRDWFWIQRILDGKPLLVGGSGDFAFQQVYVEDVARMFEALLDRPASVGKAYNVAAEEVFSLNEYLAALGRILGLTPDIVHMDQAEFDRLPLSRSSRGDVFTFNTRRTALFSLERIREDLGYRSTPFVQWMAETVRWWREVNTTDSIGYERRGEELEVIRRLTGR